MFAQAAAAYCPSPHHWQESVSVAASGERGVQEAGKSVDAVILSYTYNFSAKAL